MRRVRGGLGACSGRARGGQWWLHWLCGHFDVVVLLGQAVAVARRLVMVGWCWVAGGGAVLLGNAEKV